MAYDNAGARIGAAGHFASRLTAALIAKGGIEPTEQAAADSFADLVGMTLAVLDGLEAVPSNVVKAAFPGTTEVNEPTTAESALRIIKPMDDNHPAWLFEAAAKAGVTAVWDNRGDLAKNSKLPWYKQAEPESSDPRPFWPPRPKGR
jgi:hypothetical protein